MFDEYLYVCMSNFWLVKNTVGHGQCCSNGVWTSVWGKKVRGNGHHMPKSNHFAPGSSSPPYLPLLVLWPNPRSHWAVGEHSRARPDFCARFDTPDLCICNKLPNAEVPASTEHCKSSGIHVCGSVPAAHSAHMVGSLCFGLRPFGGCSHTEPLLVASCHCQWALHSFKPLLQGNMDWFLHESLQRNLALFQAHCSFCCHVVVCMLQTFNFASLSLSLSTF
jgi:hypothetical protein